MNMSLQIPPLQSHSMIFDRKGDIVHISHTPHICVLSMKKCYVSVLISVLISVLKLRLNMMG